MRNALNRARTFVASPAKLTFPLSPQRRDSLRHNMASRNRYSTAQPTPGRQSTVPGTQSRAVLLGELPPYKKPSHPLSQNAQDSLKTIYDRRALGLLQDHHGKAEAQITDAARMINDQLRERQMFVERRRKKWERGINIDEQDKEEAHLAELKEQTTELTRQLERDMRTMIDGGMAAQRIHETLEWLRKDGTNQLAAEYETQMSQRQTQQSQSQRRRPRQRDDDGDDDMEDEEAAEISSPGPTPLDGSRVALTGPYEMFKDRQMKKHDEYTSISHKARYADNNAYIGFKKMVHDAQYGDDGPQLPRKETWFTETGSPAPGITATQGDDDEDDLMVDRATISIKCPITLQKFKDPVTSSKCPHSFEKSAIMDMIRGSSSRLGGEGARGKGNKCVECPVTGCDQVRPFLRYLTRHTPFTLLSPLSPLPLSSCYTTKY
jgi:hypothetical protein